MTTCTPSASLSRRIRAGCDENACKCYQCKKCSSGCPVARYAGLHPAQIMRAVQLGQLDMIFDDKFIWLCTGCETCTTRCPQSIDIAGIMDELKIMARQQGRFPTVDAPFANILKLNYDSIKRWGRLYEIELLALDKLTRPSGMMDDVGLGMKMFFKGKLNLFPTKGDKLAMERMVRTSESITRAKEQRGAAE